MDVVSVMVTLKQELSHSTLPHNLRRLQCLLLWQEDIEIITRAKFLEIAVTHAIFFDWVEACCKIRDALIKTLRPCVQFQLGFTLSIELDHVFMILLIENGVLKLVQLRPGTHELVSSVVFRLIHHRVLRILNIHLQLGLVVRPTEILWRWHISIRYFLEWSVYLFIIIVYNY